MIDEKTTHQEYPLPHRSNKLGDDVTRIKDSLNQIDTDVNALNVKTATLTTDLADVKENAQSGAYLHAASTGTEPAYELALTPTLTALTVGQVIHMTAHAGNTGSATLDIDGLGVKAIKKTDGNDLETGDILSGAACFLFYDGTNFQLINPAEKAIDLSAVSANSRRIAELEALSNITDSPLDFFNNGLYTDGTSTKTTSESTAGQKDVVVTSVVGLSVGMSVDLLHATDKTKNEIAKIASITSLTLTMEDNLENTYPIGSAVMRDGLLRKVGKKKLPFSSLARAGDGRDGSINLVSAGTIYIDTTIVGSLRIDHPDAVERVVSQNPTGNAINVISPDEEGFAAGDLVLLMNKQGAVGDSADVGNYEILTVASTATGVINVEGTISKSYGGTTFANQKVTVQRIPQYTTVTINNASAKLSCSGWNGTKGGVLIFACSESFNLTSGELDVKGYGYRGGTQSGYYHGQQGEGEVGIGSGPSNSTNYPNANGVGGGGGHNSGNRAGAGGGHATAGANGPNTTGGSSIGDVNLSKLYMGGGGGAEGFSSINGGSGGGIVYILAETANIGGIITANGYDAGTNGYGAGSGAGGTVLIKANTLTFTSSNLITASGGTALNSGGAGGEGRVRLEYATIDGQAHPNTTEENDSSTPNPGSTALATLNTGALVARHRSILTSKPQRDIESMDLWTKCPVTTSHPSTSGTASAFIINGITASEEIKYGVGDTVLIKLSTGKYLENADGTTYAPKVTSNSTSGEITIDMAIPATFSGATLQRLDLIPRASIVPTGSAENMELMALQFVEETGVSNEIETEWFLDKAGSEGQDVTIEIGLSVEDTNEQENAYCEQYTTNLNYA